MTIETMSRDNWIVVSLSIILGGLFALTSAKLSNRRIPPRTFLAFSSIVAILALIRISVLLYTQYRGQSHTFSENVLNLSYLLFPELPLALLIPTHTYGAYLAISRSADSRQFFKGFPASLLSFDQKQSRLKMEIVIGPHSSDSLLSVSTRGPWLWDDGGYQPAA
jgi:ABC-type multidrug transport system permease subunit